MFELVSPIFLPSPEAVDRQVRRGRRPRASTARPCRSISWPACCACSSRSPRPRSSAIALGFAISLDDTARGIFEPIIEFYRPIPPLAYLPLVIIWFGIGEFAKILVIFLGILPSIVIATVDGLALGGAGQDQRGPLARRDAGFSSSRWCCCRTPCRAS